MKSLSGYKTIISGIIKHREKADQNLKVTGKL